jgi:hypothetical protein
MDAFIVSSLVKNSLKKKSKKLEHAAFLMNDPSSINGSTKNNVKLYDNSINDNSINDNSINDNSVLLDEDSYRFIDSGDKIYAPTDNSSNITVNNIKVSKDKKSEEYDDDDDMENEYENNNKANNISSVTFLLMLIINSYSAYLSWECNSNKNYPLVLKVVFSFFAFMFGSLYLLYYILFRFDNCNQF